MKKVPQQYKGIINRPKEVQDDQPKEKANLKGEQRSKCRLNCAMHKFIFKPKDNNSYHQAVTINYCPIISESNQFESIVPNINPDGKKYYPLFIIDADKDHYKNNEDKYIEDHEKKVLDYVQQKQELLEPKPGRKTKWCAVCKQPYEDYLDHIKGDLHSKNLRNNSFIKEIGKLSELFSEQRKMDLININGDENNLKEALSTTIDTEEDVIIIENDSNSKHQTVNNDSRKLTSDHIKQPPNNSTNILHTMINYTDLQCKPELYPKMFYSPTQLKDFNKQNQNYINKMQISEEDKLNMFCYQAAAMTPTPNTPRNYPNSMEQFQISCQTNYPQMYPHQIDQNLQKKKRSSNTNKNSSFYIESPCPKKKMKIIDLTQNDDVQNQNIETEHIVWQIIVFILQLNVYQLITNTKILLGLQ